MEKVIPRSVIMKVNPFFFIMAVCRMTIIAVKEIIKIGIIIVNSS
jgi:hypothetical protein